MSKVWLITGSSRGFGRSLAEKVLAGGDKLVATARKPETLDDLKAQYGDQVLPFPLDVTDEAQAHAAVQAALDTFGRLDVVVNNAGFGYMGAFEEVEPAEFKKVIDGNFWGTVFVTRAAIPAMRRQGSGHIMQFSSIGGRMAIPGQSSYHAAKFAVEGFSESVAQEVRPLGIKVTIVEPGGFRTDWAGASMEHAEAMPEYEATSGYIRKLLETRGGTMPGDPAKAADVLLQIAGMPEPPLRLPLGSDAFGMLSHRYASSLEELNRWKELTTSTDIEGSDIVTPDQLTA